MMGYRFVIEVPHFDEKSLQYEPGTDVEHFVEQLAVYKVLDVAERQSDQVILGADTVVWLNHQVMGKPENLEHARQMLHLLAGQKHQVITAVCMKGKGAASMQMTTELSTVVFRDLSDQEIDQYVSSGEPLGKAGSYALQENGWRFLDHIEGSFTNVVGLPVEKTTQLLTAAGIPAPPGLAQRIPRLENILTWQKQA